MKGARILQVILLVLLVLYLVWFDNVNPDPLQLPLFIMLFPMRAVFVLAAALLAGWLVGWAPTRMRLWRRNRELKRLRQQVIDLEERHAPAVGIEAYEPVIPDRYPAVPDGGDYDDDETESA